jgi:hypothetical protein
MTTVTDPDIARRRVLVKFYPKASVAELCEIFDTQRVLLPQAWFGFGFIAWSETHKILRYRARIKLLISREAMCNRDRHPRLARALHYAVIAVTRKITEMDDSQFAI